MQQTHHARETRIGYACAIAVLFVWAGFLLSSRLGARQDFTPWDVAALRYAGAFLGALPLLAVFGLPRLPPARLAVVVATAAFGFPILAYHGFGFAPAAHGGVMLPGTLPFLTAALGLVVLGERWTRRRLVSLLVVACGIGLLAGDTFGSHPGAWRGDLLFLAGSSCWAVYTLVVRLWGIDALRATLSVALWAAPLYLPVWWLLLPSNLAAVPVGAVAYQLVFQGIFAVLVAGFLFTRAVQAIGAPRTTTITALVPGMAALAAWPLLGEPLGPAGLAGVALVTAGMVIAVLPPRPR
ncbi:DMT family transporter [Falsiroseomonas sp. CW058]|uniref:DMT family transporter n=1 Tax=Falsiroseomonas sp. CW058 TaxID=3388664 RepID=UPI003D323ACE